MHQSIWTDQYDHRASADAQSVQKDLPRAPCPQAILKVQDLRSLDYRQTIPAVLHIVIQAIGRPDFEDGMRMETTVEVISENYRVRTSPEASLRSLARFSTKSCHIKVYIGRMTL